MTSQDNAPIWRLGFRPFFLFAALFALISILLWALIFLGASAPLGSFDPILWHAHEMIYGYATAVIAGFVLTASQNWTGRRGVNGSMLVAIWILWVLGRVLMSTLSSHGLLVAIVDLAFYPALALTLAPYLQGREMRTERVFLAYFTLFFAGNLAMHLDALGVLRGYGLRGALLGLNTTIVMIVFMGGRLIPFFAESEKARAQPKTQAWVEASSHATAWAFLLSQLLAPYSRLAAILAFVAFAVHLLRLANWYVRRIRRVALLWVLYSSYLWIVLGFGLFGLSSLGILALGPAVHAFTVGGLGIMTYGMMSRVSLGHTGRPLRASAPILAGYLLLNLACLIRVVGPIVASSAIRIWIGTSAALWILAFALFVWVYAPMLLRARIDGRPG
jgi:uncharacterized protein involved in response to NO